MSQNNEKSSLKLFPELNSQIDLIGNVRFSKVPIYICLEMLLTPAIQNFGIRQVILNGIQLT